MYRLPLYTKQRRFVKQRTPKLNIRILMDVQRTCLIKARK
jgi:hypothetical protein